MQLQAATECEVELLGTVFTTSRKKAQTWISQHDEGHVKKDYFYRALELARGALWRNVGRTFWRGLLLQARNQFLHFSNLANLCFRDAVRHFPDARIFYMGSFAGHYCDRVMGDHCLHIRDIVDSFLASDEP